MADGQWAMVNGRWSLGDGRWAMVVMPFGGRRLWLRGRWLSFLLVGRRSLFVACGWWLAVGGCSRTLDARRRSADIKDVLMKYYKAIIKRIINIL